MGCGGSKTNSYMMIPEKTIVDKTIPEIKFKKIKRLGKGAFGDVFLIISKKTKKKYALKEINPNPKEKVFINREIHNLYILNHPNIISIKVAFFSNEINKICIITDYAEGGDLEAEFKKRQKIKNYFEEKILLNWIFQICLALQYSHEEKKIIHRDIKPLNIFLMKNGTIKLGDFGLSKQLSQYTYYKTKSRVGTPIYIAPEIINLNNNNEYERKDDGFSFAADIWSLGVTFCQLMSLEIPFEFNIKNENIYEKIKKNIKNEKILNEDKSKYNDDIINNYSPEFLELIDWMMTVDHEKRPTAQQILEKPIVRKRMSSFLKENEFNSDIAINEINNYIEKEKNLKDFENEDIDNNYSNIKIEDIDNEDINNQETIINFSVKEEKIRYDLFRQMSLIDKSLKKNKTYKEKK